MLEEIPYMRAPSVPSAPWTAAELETILAAPEQSPIVLARRLPGRSQVAIFQAQLAVHDLHLGAYPLALVRQLASLVAAHRCGALRCPLCAVRF
jgi:hypothetical protein